MERFRFDNKRPRMKLSIVYPRKRRCSVCGWKMPKGTPILTSNPEMSKPYRDSRNVCPVCIEQIHQDMCQMVWSKVDKHKFIAKHTKDKLLSKILRSDV